MYLAIGMLHYQALKENFISHFVTSQLSLLEMVMQTTGFNQEDMQRSLVKSDLNVVSSKWKFLPRCVNKTMKLVLRLCLLMFFCHK